MTKLTTRSLFPRSAFVGFDHLLNELDNVALHANDNYPPHNIVKDSDDTYFVELAVAGFAEDELTIEVKERSLVVSGEHVNRGREYVHKGISAKKFKRTFRLSEYVEVHGANLKDGILSITLKVIVPEEKLPRRISINSNEEYTHDSKKESPQLLQEDGN